MIEESTSWLIPLVKGGAFETVWELFEDDLMTVPADLSGKSPRILLKYDTNSTLEWTTGDEITVLSPAKDGKIQISLETAEIQALAFKVANGFFFLDGENEFLAEGVVRVK